MVLTYLVVTRWFTLFFVPLIPFGRKRLLVCPICGWQRDVSKQAEPLALEMVSITSSWKAHQLADDEYARRVDAFWSFTSADHASGAGTPSDPPRAQEPPAAPPAAG